MYQLLFLLLLSSPFLFWWGASSYPDQIEVASLWFYGGMFVGLFLLKASDALRQLARIESGELSEFDAEIPAIPESDSAVSRTVRLRLYYLWEISLAAVLLAGFCFGSWYVVSGQVEEAQRFGRQPFDREIWATRPQKRFPMLLDLLEHHPFTGATPTEVLDLLGEPTASQTGHPPGRTVWWFDLGTEDWISSQPAHLVLTFEGDRVTHITRLMP